MSSENPPERILLRRLREDQWNPATGAPKRNGFRQRKTETSLSVFDASICSARFVLQLAINDALQKCQSAEENMREKGSEFLAKYGDTPERLIGNGWRVAQIPASAFTLRGFEVSAADETGHCDVTGEEELFETKAVELAQEATLFSQTNTPKFRRNSARKKISCLIKNAPASPFMEKRAHFCAFQSSLF